MAAVPSFRQQSPRGSDGKMSLSAGSPHEEGPVCSSSVALLASLHGGFQATEQIKASRPSKLLSPASQTCLGQWFTGL